MKYLLALFATMLLASCSTNSLFSSKKPQINQNAKYPPVSIIVDKGYEHSEFGCYGTGCYGYRDETAVYVFSYFEESGLFKQQYENQLGSPYKIEIDTLIYPKDGPNIGRLFFDIFTLFLIPSTTKYIAKFDITVYNKNELLKKYKYSTEIEYTSHLFNNVQGYKKEAVNILLSDFFIELENENTFDSSNKAKNRFNTDSSDVQSKKQAVRRPAG